MLASYYSIGVAENTMLDLANQLLVLSRCWTDYKRQIMMSDEVLASTL